LYFFNKYSICYHKIKYLKKKLFDGIIKINHIIVPSQIINILTTKYILLIK